MSCARASSRSCWSRMTIIGPPLRLKAAPGWYPRRTSQKCRDADAKSIANPFFSSPRDLRRGQARKLQRWPQIEATSGVSPSKSPSVLLSLQLELRGELRLRLRRHRGVMAELDGVCALAAGHRPQPRLVLVHFRERDHAADRHQVAARRFGARDLSALAGKVRGE